MPSLVVEIPATSDPVTLAQMKAFLRVEYADDDALITGLIAAATIACETFTKWSFCTKGFRQSLDSFPYFVDTIMSQMAYPPSYYALPRYSTTMWNYSQMMKLFRPPLIAVQRISYFSSGDKQWHDLVPAPPLWYPGTAYTVGFVVMDNNGNQQQCTVPGTSDSQPPTEWGPEVDDLTVEVNPDPGGEGADGVTWLNIGPLNAAHSAPSNTGNGVNTIDPQFGPFLTDNSQEPARIFPGPPGFFWPSVLYVPNSVQIHFTAGYSADGTKVPANIITAIMLAVSDWYENRVPASGAGPETLPRAVKALLWPSVIMDMSPTRG